MDYKNTKLLLACDLDRTIVPDGPEPLSDNAIPDFNSFVQSNQVAVVYISGRNLTEILAVVKDYNVANPKIIVANDGTSIYVHQTGDWQKLSDWDALLDPDWQGMTNPDIHAILKDLHHLRLQEPQHQDKYKVSYYAPEDVDSSGLVQSIQSHLRSHGLQVAVVTSVDHVGHKAYLDILPATGTKIHALNYLVKTLGFDPSRVVVCGDSGNDLTLLTYGYHAIVVNNATSAFKHLVRDTARTKGMSDQIYFATGGFKGMNGNYAAGVLEGLNYFWPQVLK